MTSSIAWAFDKTASLQRLPDTVSDSDWGGDQSDAYAELQDDIPCRYEVTRVDEITVWLSAVSPSPVFGDRIITSDGLSLDVRRVFPWFGLDGFRSHYEIMTVEVPTSRSLTDDG